MGLDHFCIPFLLNQDWNTVSKIIYLYYIFTQGPSFNIGGATNCLPARCSRAWVAATLTHLYNRTPKKKKSLLIRLKRTYKRFLTKIMICTHDSRFIYRLVNEESCFGGYKVMYWNLLRNLSNWLLQSTWCHIPGNCSIRFLTTPPIIVHWVLHWWKF